MASGYLEHKIFKAVLKTGKFELRQERTWWCVLETGRESRRVSSIIRWQVALLVIALLINLPFIIRSDNQYALLFLIVVVVYGEERVEVELWGAWQGGGGTGSTAVLFIHLSDNTLSLKSQEQTALYRPFLILISSASSSPVVAFNRWPGAVPNGRRTDGCWWLAETKRHTDTGRSPRSRPPGPFAFWRLPSPSDLSSPPPLKQQTSASSSLSTLSYFHLEAPPLFCLPPFLPSGINSNNFYANFPLFFKTKIILLFLWFFHNHNDE